MYIVKYGDAYLHDPRGDESLLTDAKLSGGLNQAGSLVFTMAPNHPLLGTVRERDASSPVEVYDGGVLVFAGYVWELSQDFKNTRTASCKGELAYLGDSLVRPYSTVEGEAKLSAPSSVSGYFQWLIDQHNSRVSEAQRFDVGRNEGALLDKNDRIYRASSQIPTTSEELQSKLLDGPGGYVFVRRENGRRVIDYLADCVDVNAQVIDFGVNLLDYARTDSASSLYTAIRPKGGKPDGSDEDATLESLPDGTYSKDARFRKDGDVVYDVEAVRKYGMIELEWSDSEAVTADGLLDSAVIALKEHTSPKTTIEIKAVDMSMFMDGCSPLRPGQLVRVRSKPHGFDSYMLVAKIDPDLNDPSQTVYTLGTTFDTVTGETNKQIRRLNASINAQIDAVAGISAEAKEAAEGALRTSEEAQTAADAASAKANQAADDLAAAEQNLANVASRVDATEEEVSAAKAAVATAQAAADKAKADAATAQSTANTAKANADTAQTAADALGVRVTAAETKIVQNAEAIVLRATKTEVDTAKSAAISAAATDATTKANNALAGAKTYADAQLKVQADRITANVSETTALGARMTTVEQTASGLSVSLESVKTTANTARTEAANAAKTASNYMQYTSAGLEVGNRSSGAWSGFRSRMAAGAFQVLDAAGNVLSSFGANLIELGKSSASAEIDLCANNGSIVGFGTPQLRGLAVASDRLSLCSKAPSESGYASSPKIEVDSGSVALPNGLTVGGTAVRGDGAWVYAKGGAFTNICTNQSSAYPVYGGRVLYDNAAGTAGTVTLAETAANFKRMTIYYTDNNGRNRASVDVWAPDGKLPTLDIQEGNGSLQTLFRRTEYSISGTALTPSGVNGRRGYLALGEGGGGLGWDYASNWVKVVAVVGYK